MESVNISYYYDNDFSKKEIITLPFTEVAPFMKARRAELYNSIMLGYRMDGIDKESKRHVFEMPKNEYEEYRKWYKRDAR